MIGSCGGAELSRLVVRGVLRAFSRGANADIGEHEPSAQGTVPSGSARSFHLRGREDIP